MLTTLLSSAVALAAPQTVFLDFDSRTGADERVFTAAERNAIVANIAADYALFDFSFTQVKPVSGDFSTLFFNSGPSGGLAQHIDFRNLDRNDTAEINLTGFVAPSNSAEAISRASYIGAHELGHLLGLRHADSYGPIGSGIHNPPGAVPYLPDYPGPTNANETTTSLMASPASVGQVLAEANEAATFNERSAVKLAFNEQPNVIDEQGAAHGSIATAQSISLAALNVPNPLPLGAQNYGKQFLVDAFAVTGALSVAGQSDFYAFQADAGDLFNFEILSGAINHRISDTIDSIIRLYDAAGNLVDYFGTPAINDDEFETADSVLIDLTLAQSGTYYLEVDNYDANDIGGYELYGFRFAAVPEPGTLALGLVALLLAAGTTRRRRA